MSMVERVGQRGRVIHAKRYTRSEICRHRDRLYVFGDNITGTGLGGQAKECRGEPNAVGIPTKWRPMMDDASFFCDEDLPKVKTRIQNEFRVLAHHLSSGGNIVWPTDGIGTGLAQLESRAPAIHSFIGLCYQHLITSSDP